MQSSACGLIFLWQKLLWLNRQSPQRNSFEPGRFHMAQALRATRVNNTSVSPIEYMDSTIRVPPLNMGIEALTPLCRVHALIYNILLGVPPSWRLWRVLPFRPAGSRRPLGSSFKSNLEPEINERVVGTGRQLHDHQSHYCRFQRQLRKHGKRA